ncbi:MAG: hypothetical protein OEM38_08905 [Gammaproteobacteria bacterium]|nr:hypothetical protein [Gammaproteobacteria bacterium]
MTELGEQLIHKSSDDFGELHVKEDGLIRTLYFGNDKKQSSIFLPDPTVLILQYTQAMTSVLLFNTNPKKILLVGLGGGSLLQYLMKTCPQSKIDVVELRESVIRLSYEFFLVPESAKNVNIIHGDAKEYVIRMAQKNSQTYDLILIDAFDAWGPVELNKDDSFIISCQSLLKYNGTVCFNLWNRKEDYFHHISKHLSTLFSGNTLELRLGKQDSNVIVFGFSHSQKLKNIQQYYDRAIQLRDSFGVDYVRFLKMLELENFSILKRIKKCLSV